MISFPSYVKNMKVVSKKIEVIVYFKKDGRINSIKFRIEESSKCQVIRIAKIISTELEKSCGNKMCVFTCMTIIENVEKIFELKYDWERCSISSQLYYSNEPKERE